MSPLGVALWLAVAASLSVYAFRLWRRVTLGPKAEREAARAASETDALSASKPGEPGAATRLIQNPIEDSGLPPADAPPVLDTPGVAAPVTDLSTPAPAPSGPPAKAVAPVPTPAPVPSQQVAAERRVARIPVAEAVAGIALPCDLAPLIGPEVRLDPFDVAFITITHDAPRVQAGVEAELTRLGFSLAPTSAHRLVASTATADMTVAVHENPAAVTHGGRPLFPTAPSGAVVVQFQT